VYLSQLQNLIIIKILYKNHQKWENKIIFFILKSQQYGNYHLTFFWSSDFILYWIVIINW